MATKTYTQKNNDCKGSDVTVTNLLKKCDEPLSKLTGPFSVNTTPQDFSTRTSMYNSLGGCVAKHIHYNQAITENM